MDNNWYIKKMRSNQAAMVNQLTASSVKVEPHPIFANLVVIGDGHGMVTTGVWNAERTKRDIAAIRKSVADGDYEDYQLVQIRSGI